VTEELTYVLVNIKEFRTQGFASKSKKEQAAKINESEVYHI
jgi:hypothetical protein